MIDLKGQSALVTGGSRGIGAAAAILLAEAGADVAIQYRRDAAAARAVVRGIKERGRKGVAFRAGVDNERDARALARRAYDAFGRIDILVNSAGIWEYGRIGAMSLAAWKKTISVNLDGTYAMCAAVKPYMKRRKYGRIVNVSSTAGQRGEEFHSHYAASKGGVIAFTKSAAVELFPDGIWVNCVAPGWVDTEMTERALGNARNRKAIERSIPRGKVASAEEIAGPILFLCSRLADHVVGEILNVNGGSVLCG
jgi:3-oxoacyl-[acyl-carrier protein] reductase